MKSDWIENLSSALGLIKYDQDWGICNSDSSRITEFISFYEQRVPEHPWEPEALAELIIASTNDGYHDATLSETTKAIVRGFLQGHRLEFPFQWAYWSKLDSREFPVVELLSITPDG